MGQLAAGSQTDQALVHQGVFNVSEMYAEALPSYQVRNHNSRWQLFVCTVQPAVQNRAAA